MSLAWKLFLAQARQQKVRLALTALAMAAATAVVLWVVSAYETIASKFDEQTSEFVGNYAVFVVPSSLDDSLSPAVIDQLESDPAVDAVNVVTQFRMWFRRGGEPREGSAPNVRGLGRMGPSVVGTNAVEPRYPLVDGRWLKPESASEAVVSSGVAEALALKPGDAIEFQSRSGAAVSLQVVGIVEQVEGVEFAMTRTKGGAPGGTNRGPASLAAYVPMQVVESLTGEPPQWNLAELRLKPEAAVEQLRSLAAAAPAVELIRPEDVRDKLYGGFEAGEARKQAYFVAALCILASAFIIFTTLSMGVSERARQLAVLRAVGLRRSQVARLVLVEALVLAVFGWIIGLAGGWLLLKMLAAASPGLFPEGVSMGGGSILLAGACSLIGALLASVLPIWKATHISPLEAMAPLPPAPRNSSWWVAAGIASLLLVAINPILVYATGMSEGLRFILLIFVGAPASILGFILLAPLMVIAVERVCGPALAGLFRLQAKLVQTQLSTNMWRTAGIAASLMLGLGLYTATQVWGFSMLSGFLPGRWTPTTIVRFATGLPNEAVEKVRATEGVVSESVLPIAVEQTRLVGDPLKSSERDSAVRQDNVVLVGIDAAAAFGGEHPLFQLEFVQGDRDAAIQQLQKGRVCLVPESFLTHAGLGVGDRIGLTPPKSPDAPVNYTIVGVLSTPGMNWITKTSGMRRNSVRTAGIVFAPQEQVRADFDLPLNEFFWLNLEPGATSEAVQERLASVAGEPGAASKDRGSERGRGPAPRAERPTGSRTRPAEGGAASAGPGGGPAGGRGRGGIPPASGLVGRGLFGSGPVQVTTLEDVRAGLRERGGAAVNAMGWLPLITLLVVSLGIVNTIAASVRARRWEFGILRAVGLRRLGLTKLVLCEALLIGFVASALSLAFGVLTGWTCLGLIRYVSNPWFEGISTPLVMPWSALAFGYGLTFVLCFAAALWPAVASGRAEPLTLLQGGRASL